MIKLISSDEDLGRMNYVSVDLAECFSNYFKDSTVYLANELGNEDHIYVQDDCGRPSFDMVVTKARKFVFLWYHTTFGDGPEMIKEMCDIAQCAGFDFAVKCPLLPSGRGLADVARVGKTVMGNLDVMLNKLSTLDSKDKKFLDYRNYDWINDDHSLQYILESTRVWMEDATATFSKIDKYSDFVMNDIKGYVLYAGCAFSYVYPNLGFGMRDIDVNAYFPSGRKMPPCIGPYKKGVDCYVDGFGKPEYCGGETRVLDIYWNRFHSSDDNFAENVLYLLNDMYAKSDRWSTIIHRPIVDLKNGEVIYTPNWLKEMEKINE